MLLRTLTRHVKEQNWFAVFIDFLIVVIGVFIGIQVANWNEARVTYRTETEMLQELRREIVKSQTITEQKIYTYNQATQAGKRSLEFLDSETPCDDCWDRIVDFMHASQWQDVIATRSAYDNMRSHGFPKNIDIINAVENYLNQNYGNSRAFEDKPEYRSLVRQIVPIDAQEHYWAHCWSLVDGMEEYVLDCPPGVSDQRAADIVKQIRSNPNIKLHLTEWVGNIVSIPATLGDQITAGQEVLSAIDHELNRR